MNNKLSMSYVRYAAMVSAAIAISGQSAIVLTGVISKVVDGDTFHIVVDPSQLPPALKSSTDKLVIRLASVDSPELNQPLGQDIKQGLTRAMAGSNAIIHVGETKDSKVEYDAYMNILAHGMYVKGMQDDIRLMLIKRGMAWSTGDDNALDAAQKIARTRRIGLWRAANPVPPWDWRNKSQTAPIASAEVPDVTSDVKSFKFMVAGNTHVSTCNLEKIGPFTLPDDLKKRGLSGIVQMRLGIPDSYTRLSPDIVQFVRDGAKLQIHYGKYNSNQESIVKLEKKIELMNNVLIDHGNIRGEKRTRQYQIEDVCFWVLYRGSSGSVIEVDYLGEEKSLNSDGVVSFR